MSTLLMVSHQTADLSGSARPCGFPTRVQVYHGVGLLYFFSIVLSLWQRPVAFAARAPACLIAAVIAHLASLPTRRLLHPGNHFPLYK